MRLTKRLFSSVVQKRPFYVTTPIFYVNAAPHLGHVYTAVVADAIQRYEQITSDNTQVTFSTGTDEHGTKIQQAAAASNQSLPEYCARISEEYKTLFRDMNIEFTDYVRTTEDRHKKAVQHFWSNLISKDYIYKARYSGWYSVNDETFVPETQIKEEIKDGEKINVSLDSGHKVEWTEEENYMFRLSAFKSHLQKWLKTDGIITPSKFQKQLKDFLENEPYFPDISVSRPSSRVHWAIQVPSDPDQSVYVWLDALINYLTVIGYPDDDVMRSRGRPWPADVQVVGKDILKFHGIYWPAFLMASGLHPPRRLLCHSHWTVDGVKMSKSKHNVISPRLTPGGLEALRYFVLREATMHSDANYSETKLIRTINAELADTLGNLCGRCTGAALNPRHEYPPLYRPELVALRGKEVTATLCDALERLPDVCRKHYEDYQFYKVTHSVIQVLHLANLFFETHKPWELKKDIIKQKELDTILHVTMETLRVTAIILQPIIPVMTSKLLDKLQIPSSRRLWKNCEEISWTLEGAIHETKNIVGGKFVLFQRIYVDKDLEKRKVTA